jgi:hypothetical protein
VEILFSEFARCTSGGISVPNQSTVASTARLPDLLSEVIPDVQQNRIRIGRTGKQILLSVTADKP